MTIARYGQFLGSGSTDSTVRPTRTSVPPIQTTSGRYNRVINVTNTFFNATGSAGEVNYSKAAEAFIVNTPGSSSIMLVKGGELFDYNLSIKTLYEFGVVSVSGSGNIDLFWR